MGPFIKISPIPSSSGLWILISTPGIAGPQDPALLYSLSKSGTPATNGEVSVKPYPCVTLKPRSINPLRTVGFIAAAPLITLLKFPPKFFLTDLKIFFLWSILNAIKVLLIFTALCSILSFPLFSAAFQILLYKDSIIKGTPTMKLAFASCIFLRTYLSPS